MVAREKQREATKVKKKGKKGKVAEKEESEPEGQVQPCCNAISDLRSRIPYRRHTTLSTLPVTMRLQIEPPPPPPPHPI